MPVIEDELAEVIGGTYKRGNKFVLSLTTCIGICRLGCFFQVETSSVMGIGGSMIGAV